MMGDTVCVKMSIENSSEGFVLGERLTCEELSDLFNEVSQVVVGAFHFVLGGGGFIQSFLGFTFGVLRFGLCLRHLRETEMCITSAKEVRSLVSVSNIK